MDGGYQGFEEWPELRTKLHVGQRLNGRVSWVPRRGAIGVGVELGFAVNGFVDVLMLPRDVVRWPALGTVTEFEIIHMDDRPQIRLRPIEGRYAVE
jgi:hypothetical protein